MKPTRGHFQLRDLRRETLLFLSPLFSLKKRGKIGQNVGPRFPEGKKRDPRTKERFPTRRWGGRIKERKENPKNEEKGKAAPREKKRGVTYKEYMEERSNVNKGKSCPPSEAVLFLGDRCFFRLKGTSRKGTDQRGSPGQEKGEGINWSWRPSTQHKG